MTTQLPTQRSGRARSARAVALCCAWHATGLAAGLDGQPGAFDASPAAVIGQLPAGGSDPWDAAVRRVLHGAYDMDQSGWLDTPDEVAAVPCDVWRRMDAGVQAGWGTSLYTVYGFEPRKAWVGSVLGISAGVRTEAAEALARCDLVSSAPSTALPSSLAPRIRALPEGGSDPWDAAVRSILVSTYDDDRSGVLDREHEVRAVPCEAWHAIDAGVRQAWPSGLYVTYGFDRDLVWLGSAIGLDEGARDAVVEALRSCAVQGTDDVVHFPSDPAVFADALQRLPGAGGGAWSAVVRRSLLAGYDGDQDERLATRVELEAVPCGIWRAMDGALLRDRGQGLLQSFGFTADDRWLGYALGVPGASRAIASDVLTGCGLTRTQAPGPLAVPVASSSTQLPELFHPFDLDGSGWLDSAREVAAVPCAAWRALDARAHAMEGVGLVALHGLRRGPLWAGDSLGVAEAARPGALRAVKACLP